jgi:hypothetical protein
VAGQPVTVTYDPAGRNLASATSVNIHHGFNGANWNALPGAPMTKSGSNWVATYTVASNATTIAMVFNTVNSGSTNWDNNTTNWNFSVTNQPPTDSPSAPTGLTAVNTTTNSIMLSWNAAPTASGYILFRNSNQIATPTGTAHTDTGLSPDTTYTYSLRATNSAGVSALSSNLGVTTSFIPLEVSQITLLAPGSAATTPDGSYLFRGRA